MAHAGERWRAPPIISDGVDATITTNSGNYDHYEPGLTKRKIRFMSIAGG